MFHTDLQWESWTRRRSRCLYADVVVDQQSCCQTTSESTKNTSYACQFFSAYIHTFFITMMTDRIKTLRSPYDISRPSVCLSVCRLSNNTCNNLCRIEKVLRLLGVTVKEVYACLFKINPLIGTGNYSAHRII